METFITVYIHHRPNIKFPILKNIYIFFNKNDCLFSCNQKKTISQPYKNEFGNFSATDVPIMTVYVHKTSVDFVLARLLSYQFL